MSRCVSLAADLHSVTNIFKGKNTGNPFLMDAIQIPGTKSYNKISNWSATYGAGNMNETSEM